jgi:hypothetical protein
MLVPEVERILTVDLATARSQAKEAAPTTTHERGGQHPTFAKASQNVVVAATLLDTLPTLSIDAVDRLYHQSGEILAITMAQQVECSL